MKRDPRALFIVETLAKAGFVAYYAGGWVRDFLLGHPSDDIDIATNAPPETIQALFSKTVPIGISFGILLVIVEGHPFEVATFRHDLEYKDGRRPSKIAFTNAVEDAKRRDFTINGMFYDPLKEQVLDFVRGQEDLKKGIIRAIGNPHQRIQEDRLRMIRGIRLACRFGFTIEPETALAIESHVQELFPAVAMERVVQELEKGRSFGKLGPMLKELHKFGLLEQIFPELSSLLSEKLSLLESFPKEAPLIAFLVPLFPANLDIKALCKRLKLSNEELLFGTFFYRAAKVVTEKEASLFTWAHLYAHPSWPITFQLMTASRKGDSAFVKEHQDRMKRLHPFIQKIVDKTPLVQAEDLFAIGIPSGKEMGELLAKAEQISINEEILDKQVVLERICNPKKL